jgi:hypothetical protein
MSAEGEADLAGVEVAAFVLLRPDHDGPEDAVVGGGGEDSRETGGEFGEGEVFGHGGFPGEVAWSPGE